MRDSGPDDAPVLLKLGLALAAHCAPAALARKVGPRPGEPRQGVLHAGQGDLQDGLAGVGAVREHLEDDLLAVDDRHGRKFLPVALLRGRERGVEDDYLGPVLPREGRQLSGLALAEEQRRSRAAQPHQGRPRYRKAQVLDKLGQLGQEFFPFARGHLRCLHANQEGALGLGQGGKEVGHLLGCEEDSWAMGLPTTLAQSTLLTVLRQS